MKKGGRVTGTPEAMKKRKKANPEIPGSSNMTKPVKPIKPPAGSGDNSITGPDGKRYPDPKVFPESPSNGSSGSSGSSGRQATIDANREKRKAKVAAGTRIAGTETKRQAGRSGLGAKAQQTRQDLIKANASPTSDSSADKMAVAKLARLNERAGNSGGGNGAKVKSPPAPDTGGGAHGVYDPTKPQPKPPPAKGPPWDNTPEPGKLPGQGGKGPGGQGDLWPSTISLPTHLRAMGVVGTGRHQNADHMSTLSNMAENKRRQRESTPAGVDTIPPTPNPNPRRGRR